MTVTQDSPSFHSTKTPYLNCEFTTFRHVHNLTSQLSMEHMTLLDDEQPCIF